MRYMIFPYKQNSEGAIALATELQGQRILRENSKYVRKDDDLIINWGASDCPYEGALNLDNRAVLDKLRFFQRLKDKELTPRFSRTLMGAETLYYPIYCRTKLRGRDGAGIIVADNVNQLVPCELYVEGINKSSEYRVHVGRLPDGTIELIGAQKKVHGQPHTGQDPRVWTGESTRFVWKVNNVPAAIPDNVINVVKSAFAYFPELTFGAFDVVYNYQTDNAFVLEINSAPMMTPETARRYGDFFREYVAMKATEQVTLPLAPQPAPATPAPIVMTMEEVLAKLINGELSITTLAEGYLKSLES